MSKLIPFPSTIVALSSERARASQKADKKRPRVGDVEVTLNTPAYRRPDGHIQLCYDPYTPSYPADCEPGLATQRGVMKYYPNDTMGYQYSASDFITLGQAKENGVVIDDLSARQVLLDDGGIGLLIGTRAEADTREAEISEQLAGSGKTEEPVIFRLGPLDAELNVFCSFNSGFVKETWAAPNEEMLAVALHARFNHAMGDAKPEDFEEVAAMVRHSCETYGHKLAIGTRAELELDLDQKLSAVRDLSLSY